MTGGGFNKTGWHWTRQGFKRTLRHSQRVRIAVMPKRRKRKTVRLKGAEPGETPPNFIATRKLAVEQGTANSAPTPAPGAGKLTMRPMRRAWGGKYDELATLTKGERNTGATDPARVSVAYETFRACGP